MTSGARNILGALLLLLDVFVQVLVRHLPPLHLLLQLDLVLPREHPQKWLHIFASTLGCLVDDADHCEEQRDVPEEVLVPAVVPHVAGEVLSKSAMVDTVA